MFYYVNGMLAHKEPGFAVIDCGGVGYRLTVSQNTLAALDRAAVRESKVKLFTYMAVREDDVELFGFYTEEELTAFRQLKAAMGVLSAFTPDGLARAVCTEDVKAIAKSNGVGAKGAARIVLELKDKMSYAGGGTEAPTAAATAAPAAKSAGLAEAAEALTALGYARAEVNAVLSKLDTAGMTSGDIIRAALAQFMKG